MTISATTLEFTPASSGPAESPVLAPAAGLDSLCLAHEWIPLADTVFSYMLFLDKVQKKK